jgi:hypothetical protein
VSTIHPTERDDPGAPLPPLARGGMDALVGWLAGAEKPRARFRVGTEHEKFGFVGRFGDQGPPAPLPFDGPDGIEALLDAIADDELDRAAHGPWTRAQDRGRTIALFRGDASITLEPGGQVELSGAPHRALADLAAGMAADIVLCGASRVTGSGIGGIEATQAAIDFCAAKNIVLSTKLIPVEGINGAFEALARGNDSGERFVIDLRTLDSGAEERCRGVAPPALGPPPPKVTVGGIVASLASILCCCRWR